MDLLVVGFIALVIYLYVNLVFVDPPGRVGMTVNLLGLVPRDKPGGVPMIEVTYTDSTKARIRVNPKNSATGKPAPIQAGSLAVIALDGTGDGVNAVTAIENADTFTIQHDRPGEGLNSTLHFEVSADADLGDGDKTIRELIVAHCTVDQADALGSAAVEIVPR